MTITGAYEPDRYTITSGQVDFNITFEFVSSDYISAVVTDQTLNVDTELTNGVDFTISGTTLTTVVQQTVGFQLTIYLNMPFTQATDYKNTGDLDLETIEQDFDKAVLERQQLQEVSNRNLILPLTDTDTVSNEAPKYAAGEYWKWDEATRSIATALIQSTGTASIGTSVDDLVKLVDVSGTPGFPILSGANMVDIDAGNLKDGTAGELISWDTAGSATTIAPSTAGRVLTSNGAGQALSMQDLDVNVSDLHSGTAGELITWDTAGSATTIAPSTAGKVLTSNGAGQIPSMQSTGITLGTVVNPSTETIIDFTSIPSGTKRVTVMFHDVTLSGADNLMIRIGDSSAGVSATGYESLSSYDANNAYFTNGFGVRFSGITGSFIVGSMVIELVDSVNHKYLQRGIFQNAANTIERFFTAGSKTLPGEIDRVRLTFENGSVQFTGGAINISYE